MKKKDFSLRSLHPRVDNANWHLTPLCLKNKYLVALVSTQCAGQSAGLRSASGALRRRMQHCQASGFPPMAQRLCCLPGNHFPTRPTARLPQLLCVLKKHKGFVTVLFLGSGQCWSNCYTWITDTTKRPWLKWSTTKSSGSQEGCLAPCSGNLCGTGAKSRTVCHTAISLFTTCMLLVPRGHWKPTAMLSVQALNNLLS